MYLFLPDLPVQVGIPMVLDRVRFLDSFRAAAAFSAIMVAISSEKQMYDGSLA
jgi:hypothetical protein